MPIEVGLKRLLISLIDKLQKIRSQNIEELHEPGDGVLVLVFCSQSISGIGRCLTRNQPRAGKIQVRGEDSSNNTGQLEIHGTTKLAMHLGS